MLVSDVLLRARDTLADPSGDRWSDDRLLRLIDEAQKTIVIASKCLRNSVKFPVRDKQMNYSLPEDYIGLIRVSYNSKALSIISEEVLDTKYDMSWETTTGTPEYVIAHTLNRGIIRLVPIPSNTNGYIRLYYNNLPATITDISDELELEELYKPMIIKYVTGSALRDDLDSQNRAFGNEELSFFNNWLEEIKIQTSKDMINNNIYMTQYRSSS